MRGSTWSPLIMMLSSETRQLCSGAWPLPVTTVQRRCADGQHIAVADALEAGGQRIDDLVEIAPGLGAHGVDSAFGPAGADAEIDRLGRRCVAHIQRQRARQQIFGAGDFQRHVPALAQPAGEAEVIGVVMGDDERG